MKLIEKTGKTECIVCEIVNKHYLVFEVTLEELNSAHLRHDYLLIEELKETKDDKNGTCTCCY